MLNECGIVEALHSPPLPLCFIRVIWRVFNALESITSKGKGEGERSTTDPLRRIYVLVSLTTVSSLQSKAKGEFDESRNAHSPRLPRNHHLIEFKRASTTTAIAATVTATLQGGAGDSVPFKLILCR